MCCADGVPAIEWLFVIDGYFQIFPDGETD